ncbi:hypothetical protein [Rubritalea tangerina]|uniref:Uncharacterized protein n=1 Tax=Rubritalea tangerina TaxID=430798 RepID=A0ABW4Z7C0_9BACT
MMASSQSHKLPEPTLDPGGQEMSSKQKQVLLIVSVSCAIACILVGLYFYHESANRAACIINQSSITKSAEAWYGINGQIPKNLNDLTGPTAPFPHSLPVCPSGGTYIYHSHNLKHSKKPVVSCSCKGHVYP